MNGQRRKSLDKLVQQIATIQEELGEVDLKGTLETYIASIKDIQSELGSLIGDEEEYYDDMPESLQSGEKGDRSQEALGYMEDAVAHLGDALTTLSEPPVDLEIAASALGDAGGWIDEACSA